MELGVLSHQHFGVCVSQTKQVLVSRERAKTSLLQALGGVRQRGSDFGFLCVTAEGSCHSASGDEVGAESLPILRHQVR